MLKRIRRQQVSGPPRLQGPQPRVGLWAAEDRELQETWGYPAAEGKFLNYIVKFLRIYNACARE